MADKGRNPDALEQEIERTREELARTVDTIVDRVSPRSVAQRSMDTVRDRVAAIRDGANGQQPALTTSEESLGSGARIEVTESGAGEAVEGHGGMAPAVTRTAIVLGAGLAVTVLVVAWRRSRR